MSTASDTESVDWDAYRFQDDPRDMLDSSDEWSAWSIESSYRDSVTTVYRSSNSGSSTGVEE